MQAAPRWSWVLHLDVDAFFAAVEQRDDPRLRGRPVAVGTGVVASCSYEAKRRGVFTGMRLLDARRMCSDLVVLPGDVRRYELAARQILGICQECTPRVEVAALDDLYLDLGSVTSEQAAEQARALAGAVEHEVGLAVSLGLGSNKLVASVATTRVKRRKARPGPESTAEERRNCQQGEIGRDVEVVPPGTEASYLAPWPVDVLPGVGPKARARLERLNVRRVGELAEMPLGVLSGLFGKRGRVLRDRARGIDPRPVQPTRPAVSISRRTSFDPPVSEEGVLLAMLDHLLDRAVMGLRLQGLGTRGLTVSVRYADHRSADSRVSFSRTVDREGELRQAGRERLSRLWQRRLPLRLLGVELSPVQAREEQRPLFPEPAEERDRRLSACKDVIRSRFGFLAVVPGSTLVLRERLEHDRDNYRLRTPCLTR